jgi:hypothetical protein
MSDAIVDFETATPQEKFMMMMNDRIGNVEETLHELREMMSSIYGFLTTKALNASFCRPQTGCLFNQSFLERLVTAIQRTPKVSVAEAWVIVYPVSTHLGVYNASIYLRLKQDVIAKQVTNEMNEHIIDEFKFPIHSYPSAWTGTYLDNMDKICNASGISEKSSVFHKVFE